MTRGTTRGTTQRTTQRTTWRGGIMRALMQEDLNFLLTNRLPRRLATQFVGRIARIEHPLIARPALALWRFFAGVDLSDSATSDFRSLRDGFTRALKSGARAFDADPATIASPCDAVVGAHGPIEDGQAFQVKGFPYSLADLVPDPAVAKRFHDGRFVTLRLTAGMYHRFHAPADLVVEAVTHVSGDCWNVNPIALKRVERLFCRNERVVIEARLADGTPLLLVAVAAILVASVRLTFEPLHPRRPGTTRYPCDVRLPRGAEMGWFEHGSTILLFLPTSADATILPPSATTIRAGQPLASRGSSAFGANASEPHAIAQPAAASPATTTRVNRST